MLFAEDFSMTGKPAYEELERLVEERTHELE